MRTKNEVVIDLPVVLSANDAKKIADQVLYNGWLERDMYSFSLPFKYAYLAPGNVVSMTVGSVAYKIRLQQVRVALSELKVYCEGVAADLAVFDPNANGGVDARDTVFSYSGYVSSVAQLIDCSPLRIYDDSAGFYIAVGAYSSGWSQATMYRSTDGGLTYSAVQSFFAESMMGFATTALSDTSTPEVWDYANTLTVRMYTANASLQTDSELNVLNGANVAILGNEIIQWRTATDNGDGSYTLSQLLRGRFGTEWATSGHAIGDRFVVLSEASLYRRSHEVSDIDSAYYYKVVSEGGFLQDAEPIQFTDTGESLRPFSPVQLSASWSGNDVTLTWVRRDRIRGKMLWSPALSEDSEEYEVDIYDYNGGTEIFLRTETVTSATTTYTNAEQVADDATPSRDYVFYVYQMSAQVGRGHVASLRSTQ